MASENHSQILTTLLSQNYFAHNVYIITFHEKYLLRRGLGMGKACRYIQNWQR